MRGKWWLLLLLVACVDDEFPTDLYNYQVERLLSSGESKQWQLTSTVTDGLLSNPAVCTDSTRLYIEVAPTDSIQISRLTPNSACDGFDTLRLGKANASGELIFTDSILFEDGSSWLIRSITSTSVSISTSNNVVETFTSN